MQFREHVSRCPLKKRRGATIRVCRGRPRVPGALPEIMGITFREAVAEVELGLVAGDQLSDIATAGLLEGYESPALVTLRGPVRGAARSGRSRAALDAGARGTEPAERGTCRRGEGAGPRLREAGCRGRAAAAARRQQDLRAAPVDGARRCDGRRAGDCIGAGGILALFYAHDGHGYYLNPRESERIDQAIMDECHRLAVGQHA